MMAKQQTGKIINKPATKKYWLAVSLINRVFHIGETTPGQVTETGFDFIIGLDDFSLVIDWINEDAIYLTNDEKISILAKINEYITPIT